MAHYDPLHPSPSPYAHSNGGSSYNLESQPLHAPSSPQPSGSYYNLRDDGPLPEPRPLGGYGEPEPRNSIVSYGTGSPYRDSAYMPATPSGSTTFLGGSAPSAYRDDPYASTSGFKEGDVPMSPMGQSRGLDKNEYAAPAKKKGSSLFRCGVIILVILLIAIAVLIPVYLKFIKPNILSSENASSGESGNSNGGSGGGHGGGGGSGGGKNQDPITGGDGSTVKLTEGGTMVYTNKFGGFWVENPDDPFDNSARPNSWTKPLNQSWDYSTDKIYGVNLGGWLNTEPFISPALYERCNTGGTVAVDEWTLSECMAKDTANGGLEGLMEEHYKTFITEEDFAQIAAAGLNWVRIPIAYWAIEVWPGEPFLPKVSWKYFLKAIRWARKYGLRINLDLHAVPGSQNAWNHSGRLGHGINFLNGPMGLANAQRTLNYIRILTQFISQPQYKDVIPFFGVVNEALVPTIGQDQIGSFYMEVYNIIRNISGTGEGNGPMISVHDGFIGLNEWNGFFEGADRVALDTHTYLAFGGVGNDPLNEQVLKPCQAWASNVNNSMKNFGFIAAGEWSNAMNDCGLNVNGVDLGTRYEGTYIGFAGRGLGAGACDQWTDYQKWDATTRAAVREFNMASMDALQNWFFWTWHIGNSSLTNKIEAPFWSYKLGLAEGWITKDPREAYGTCASQGLPSNPFNAPLQAWQTGGAGAGNIVPAQMAKYGTWPPTTINNANAPYATYTQTASITTMPAPTYTAVHGKTTKTFDAGSGWYKTDDTGPAYTTVAGCMYAPAWDAIASPSPMTCTNQRRWPIPRPTSPPKA
ncbi:unnamed protein product [Rhizoctonia solani]|uniref:glucan 1,3-beta-glucosidase n=1 Tax=Rhizoctonia solani TaxID=456999 RepID=A0A8H2X498_9AGAM|nr:unnamed protein product [Rhizoctonia solani]